MTGDKRVVELVTATDRTLEFSEACKGFFDLCGGLLKLHNLSGGSTGTFLEHVTDALDVHKKICDDFIGGKDA